MEYLTGEPVIRLMVTVIHITARNYLVNRIKKQTNCNHQLLMLKLTTLSIFTGLDPNFRPLWSLNRTIMCVYIHYETPV